MNFIKKTTLLSICLFNTFAAFSSETNMPNAGFEEGLIHWGFKKGTETDNPIEIDETQAHSGTKSARIRHKLPVYSNLGRILQVKPNTDYTLSVWVKLDSVVVAEGGVAVELYLQFGDNANTSVATPSMSGTSDWQQIRYQFNSANHNSIFFALLLHNSTGTVWFDDVELSEGKHESSPRKLPGDNLALGKTYTMNPAPNYTYCTDPDDAIQLTDGRYANDLQVWVDPAMVGWMYQPETKVIIDLGEIRPIKRIAAGVGGGERGNAGFPNLAFLVSDDGVHFYPVGHFFGADFEVRDKRYITRYDRTDLQTRGRYVAVVSKDTFVFIDEIEVMAGDFPAESINLTGKSYDVKELKNIFDDLSDHNALSRSLLKEEIKPLETTVKTIGNAPWSRHFETLAKTLSTANDQAQIEQLHKQFGLLNAEIAAQKFSGKKLLFTQNNGWRKIRFFDLPKPSAPNTPITIQMGSNEYESGSFSVFNATPETIATDFSISDLHGTSGTIPAKDVTLRYGEWATANDMIRHPDALVLVDGKVKIDPGSNRQFWIMLKGKNYQPGHYSGRVKFDNQTIPLELIIHSATLPESFNLWSANWAYPREWQAMLDQPANAMQDLAEHYIDTAVIIDLPEFTFDENGAIIKKDYTAFDQVIKDFKKANIHRFLLAGCFASMTDSQPLPFGRLSKNKFDIGSKVWNDAIDNMIRDWSNHLLENGLNFEDFLFYPVDEGSDRMLEQGGMTILEAFKRANPAIKIFYNPTDENSTANLIRLSEVVDVWCPHINSTGTNFSSERLHFFSQQQQQGKKVVAYNCEGPNKRFAPLGHFRKLPHLAETLNFDGIGFWAYGDTGWAKSPSGVSSSWTDFDGGRGDFAIVYDLKAAPVGVTEKEAQIPSRRWEAWRDGMEDFAFLRLLKSKISEAKQAGNTNAALNAEQKLTEAKKLILSSPDDISSYQKAKLLIFEALNSLN